MAKPSSSDSELAANIEYACNHINGCGCDVIKEGGPCFLPNTLLNHASVAMNLYYQFNGRNTWNCDYKDSALTTTTDPSKNLVINCCNNYVKKNLIVLLMIFTLCIIICRLWPLSVCLALSSMQDVEVAF